MGTAAEVLSLFGFLGGVTILVLLALLNAEKDKTTLLGSQLAALQQQLALEKATRSQVTARDEALVAYLKSEIAGLEAELASSKTVDPDAVRQRLTQLLTGLSAPPT